MTRANHTDSILSSRTANRPLTGNRPQLAYIKGIRTRDRYLQQRIYRWPTARIMLLNEFAGPLAERRGRDEHTMMEMYVDLDTYV